MYSLKTVRTFFTLLLLVVTINLNAQNLYQTTSDSKLRSGPGVKFKSLGIIKNGEKVNVIEKRNLSWFKIEYNNRTGYLYSKNLIPIVEAPKVEEIPKIESENAKSSSPLEYVIGAVIIIILIFIVSSNNKKKKSNDTQTFNHVNSNITIEKKQEEKLIKNIPNNIKIEVSTPNSNNFPNDESIIDVTGNGYSLRSEPSTLLKSAKVVPAWKHQYVYSFSEINSATNEQINFYNLFKYHFLRGEYFDLEGNTNYAFILLFDLINDYENHKNIKQVERHLEELGQYYPKTKSYALPSLIKKLEQIGDSEALSQLRNTQSGSFNYRQTNSNTGYSFDGNYWGLGTQFQKDLNLSNDEVTLLNTISYYSNNFFDIKYCGKEIIKLYLSLIKELNLLYKNEGTDLNGYSGPN